ncbi:MAG: DsbA family protein [Myxococcales bacterium]|nr:DsbA family protein [Myxococcales bacterium]
MSTPSTPARPSPAALLTLLGTSLGLSALAVYQWSELLVVRAGGTPACAVNESFDCAAVWNSAFAGRVHDALGMPVAALGLLWGLTALVLPAVMAVQARAGKDVSAFLTGVKLWAGAGLLACVTFIAASLQAGAVCLTCLGTYALTLGYAVGAFALLPRPIWPDTRFLVPGGAWALIISAPLFLVLLYPGGQTPKTVTKPDVKVGGQATPEQLAQWVASLSQQEKLQAAYARDVFLKSTPKDVSAFPVRLRVGPADAPIKVVEFTDILCGHCRMFESLLAQLMAMDPKVVSVEPRYYPLDGECNPDVEHSPKDGVRCFGAKAQLCLEQHPRFLELRHELFEHQAGLTKDFIVQVAGKAGLGKDALEACVNSPETGKRLAEDIAYAKLYGIQGTPLVLVNGKEAPPATAFLVGLVLAKGDANAPLFQSLPAPPAP